MTTTWVTPAAAMYLCGRPEATVRDWMRRGLLPVACSLATRRLIVPADAVADLALSHPSRHAARRRPARRLASALAGVT